MSDNTQRTELLTRLYEQNLITEDQLSRAKLYLQFISNVSFDSQDGAIDWLLENRIISERPVTNEPAIEQETVEENQPENIPEPEAVEENQPEDIPEPEVVEENQPEDNTEPEIVEESQPEDIPEPEIVEENQPENIPEPEAVEENQTENTPEPETVEENQPENIPEPETVEENQTEDIPEPETAEESQPEDIPEPEIVEENQPEDIPEPEIVEESQPEDIPEEIASNSEIVIEEVATESAVTDNFQPESPNIEHDETSSTDSDVLEMLMLLYYSGILNERTIKRARTALSQHPDIHFKDSDELLVWLEKHELVKKPPTNSPQKKKKKSAKTKQYITPPKSTVKLPPSVTPASAPVKKSNGGGCLKKLLIIAVAVVILIVYFTPSAAPDCNNIKIVQQLNQSFNAIDNAKPSTNNIRLQKIIGQPIFYRLNSIAEMSQTTYNDESRVRSCTASVTYKASGRDKTATDIVEEFNYQVVPTSKSDFTVNIEDRDKIIRKVNGENAYYNMLSEKEQGIKIAFLAGLMQLDKIINGGNTGKYIISMPEKVTWIKILSECEVTKDPYYICPLAVGYNDGLMSRMLDDANKDKELELYIDMPVVKKDDQWYPTNGFFSVFLTAYREAHQAVEEKKQTETPSSPAIQTH
ncbi:MAG: hypothetical protein ACK5M5_13805 [Limnobaculum xujianqingii]